MARNFRVAIIGRTGHGDYGHGLDAVWRLVPQAEVVAVADDDERGRDSALRKTGAKKAYADYRRMLEMERPEIVTIGTRWIDQHHAMITTCAEFGCHVYMEKPFCRTLEEADDIVRRFEMRHLKLAIAHTTRYSPVLAMARKLIADGTIGQVLEARARGKEDSRGGGEDFWVLGSHLVDLFRAFFGDPNSCWATVSADGHPVAKADVSNGNEGIGPLAGDAVSAEYSFEGGIRAYVASRRNAAGIPPRFGVQVFGSKGVLEITTGYLPSGQILKDSSWSPGRSGAKWQPFSSAGIAKPQPPVEGEMEAGNLAAVRDLMGAIENERQPKCSMYDARWTIEMISAAYESHRLKRAVSFPLQTRKNPLTLLDR